jgi:hypothetical protein
MRITFNNENLLSQIRKTILNQEFNHSFGNDSFYCPNETTYDRYSKIDAHSVFAVAFYFSSKKALSNQVHISEYSDSNVGVQPDTFAMRFSSL